MKKIKVLTSLVGLTGLSMGLIPTIASCSCSTGLQVEFVSKKKEREFNQKTNACSYTFKLTDIEQIKNIKVKIVDLKVNSTTVQTVSGLIKTTYDSAGNIKVYIDTNVLIAQWPSGTEFKFDLLFTNKTNGQTCTFSDFKLNYEEIISAPNFSTLEWSEITPQINSFYNGDISADQFAQLFGDEDGTPFSNMDELIGSDRIFKINGQDHKFKVIDSGHDKLASPKGAITTSLFTFDCISLLSDTEGNYLEIQYNSTNVFNYLEGELYKGLNATDGSDITWRKSDSTTVTTKSVYEQLNKQLGSDLLKPVEKEVWVYEDAASKDPVKETYTSYCTPLSLNEICREDTGCLAEGSPYTYWAKHKDDNSFSERVDMNGNCPYECWLVGGAQEDWQPSSVFCIDINNGLVCDNDPQGYSGVSFTFCI